MRPDSSKDLGAI